MPGVLDSADVMQAVSRLRRRSLLGALCAGVGATLLRRQAHGQARALPLENLGLEHLDIVVPDPAASARFYKHVFSSPLHEQDFRGGKRYFVLRGGLPLEVARRGKHVAQAVIALVAGVLEYTAIFRPCLHV